MVEPADFRTGAGNAEKIRRDTGGKIRTARDPAGVGNDGQAYEPAPGGAG